MGSERVLKMSPPAAVLIAMAILGGCNTTSSNGPVASAAANGDAAIATAIDAPPGSNEDFIVNVGRRVYFTESSAELNDTAKVTLDKQAAWLTSYPAYKIKIEGFADDPGSPDANKALGLRRAQAMQAYLAAKGVSPARMRVKSFGNDQVRLVKKCADISCWSQNRRGVTVLDTEVGS
ncbi:MAG: OmpA family protein [Methylobacteriaceae bacterium]|nr:OmpA family protein [Methylobacteriaceae bacterium]